MHGSLAFLAGYAAVLRRGVPTAAVDVLLFPPACYLRELVVGVAELGVGVGAQNVHPRESGAFTGEIAAPMIRDLGAGWVLVGHSERRAGCGETDVEVAEKCRAALAADLRPILCVGENLAEREAGSAEAVVLRQLDAVVGRIGSEQLAQICIAYEPVWAIGTGRTATPAQAQAMHRLIRDRLVAAFGRGAESVRILYGGSVTPENAPGLFAEQDIDGALVGGASLAAERFLEIIGAAVSAAAD
jgi:triosephosphate isomerase